MGSNEVRYDPEPVFNEDTGKWEWPKLEPLMIRAENVHRVIEQFPPEYPLPGGGGGYSVYAMRGRPNYVYGTTNLWMPAQGGLPSLGKGYS